MYNMSESNHCTTMKSEDLTLELFSLQLELDQVLYSDENQPEDDKMCSTVASPISVSSTKLESPHHGSGLHNYFDMSMYRHHEPMCIDEHAINPDQLNIYITNAAHPKSSDEGTVIDDDMIDVIHQTIQEVSTGCHMIKSDPGEFTSPSLAVPLSVCVSHSTRTSSSAAVTPNHSEAASSNDSYKGSRPSSPPGDVSGRKKKLKTRHARGSHVPSASHNTSYSPYASPPTPATPVSTPVNSCPSSPGGSGHNSGPFDHGSRKGSISVKSTAEESGSEGKGSSCGSKMPRHMRPSHIRAEHKRRNKIQTGLEDIQKLVPSVKEVVHAGGRDSKAAVLSKRLKGAVDYCRQLVGETKAQRKEMERLKRDIEALREEINSQQSELPASGVRVSNPPSPTSLPPSSGASSPSQSQQSQQQGITCQQMFTDYMNSRSIGNWKFWIFGLLVRPLFESYTTSVQTTTEEDFNKSVMKWCKSQLSLFSLRPSMLNFMRNISENTSIRTNPEKLKEEVIEKVMAENFPSPTSQGKLS